MIWPDAGRPVKFSFNEALNFIDTCLLIVVDPSYAVKLGNLSNVVGKFGLDGWELKVLIKNGDNILLVLKRTPQLFVDPIFACLVTCNFE